MLLFARRHASRAELVTTLVSWGVVSVPAFVVRVARRHGVRAALRGLRRDVGWNFRDAARRGWRVPADGPPIGGG
jgi:phosphopantetheine adenylyltransferase